MPKMMLSYMQGWELEFELILRLKTHQLADRFYSLYSKTDKE